MSRKKSVRAIVLRDQSVLCMKRDKFGMQYYVLVGGGVKIGEDPETALRREVKEETGLELGEARLVFTEDAGELYGEQYVFLCEYKGGEPALAPDSEEALIGAAGKNTYEPLWLPLSEITKVAFRSTSIRDALLDAVQNGFPDTPETLDWKWETVSR